MVITNEILDELTEKAKASVRLRMNFDLRNSAEDNSQRMLNAMEPGTVLPIHRHRSTSEVVIILRGSIKQHVYDSTGVETECVLLDAKGDIRCMTVPTGQWHRAESLEPGTVIFEAKDGKYEPLAPEDILND